LLILSVEMASFSWYALFLAVTPVCMAIAPAYEVSSGDVLCPDYGLTVFAPNSNESFPVIFFLTGFGGNAPVRGYSDLLTKIANKGYIIAALQRTGVPSYPKEAWEVHDVMTWAKAGSLKSEMIKEKLFASPDFERTALMGQSAGNHVLGQALADGCMYAKAFVMIDPVDGVDPYGIVKTENLITPGTKVNFTVPSLILDNGLDPQRAFPIPGFPPCMPISLGSPRWYNAWNGPIWHVNATAYGHVDCLNDGYTKLGGLVCKSDSKTDKALYRTHLADTATLFLGALFNGKPDDLLLLEDPKHFNVDVVLEHDRKGLAKEQILPGCTNVASMTLV